VGNDRGVLSSILLTDDHSQPVQPGRPADAAGYLKSRRGWLGYEASRAKAGYFGRLLTTLGEIRYLLEKADFLFDGTEYEADRTLQPGRQDPIYNCYLAINAVFGSIYDYAEALGRLQLFGAIVAQCPKPESGETADLKSILPGILRTMG
jgi:hypothetical protein